MVFPSSVDRCPQPVSLARNTLFNTVGCLVYQGCMWVTTVLVVLLSGYEDSGVLAYAMAIGNIFLAIASFNIRVFQVSDSANKYTTGNYLAFRLVTILLAFILLLPYTVMTTQDSNLLIPVFVYLLFKMDEAFSDVLYGIDQKNQRMDYIGVSQFCRGLLMALVFAGGLTLFHNISVSFFLMFACGLLFTLTYDLPHSLRFGSIDVSVSFNSLCRLFFDGLPVVLSLTLFSGITTFARQAFGNTYGSEALGMYAAVATPAVLIQAAARYLYSPALVPLSNALSRQDKAAFTKMYCRTIVQILFAAAVSMLLLGFAGPAVLKAIYGQNIAGYTYLLPGVLAVTFTLAFGNFFIDILTILRNIKFAFAFVATGFISCCIIASGLIDLFYMNGLNAAIFITAFLVDVLCLVRIFVVCRRL